MEVGPPFAERLTVGGLFVVFDLRDFVVLGEDDDGRVLVEVVDIHGAERQYVDDIARHDVARCSTVDGYNARATLAWHDIGEQARAVGFTVDVKKLILFNISRVHQVFIDGNTSFVIEAGLRNDYRVNL